MISEQIKKLIKSNNNEDKRIGIELLLKIELDEDTISGIVYYHIAHGILRDYFDEYFTNFRRPLKGLDGVEEEYSTDIQNTTWAIRLK